MNKSIRYIILFIALTLIVIWFTLSFSAFQRKQILEQELNHLKNEYEFSIKDYKSNSDIYFVNVINTKAVIELMIRANNSNTDVKNNARAELYDLLIDSYTTMQKFNLHQMHFHLPNNESFLRFHAPDFFGDDLTNERETVAYVNRELKPVSGFEAGKKFIGYRFVYPIIHDGNHLGSVETAISMATIVHEIEAHTHAAVAFIISKSVVDKKVLEEDRIKFKPSFISDTYLLENSSSLNTTDFMKSIISKHNNLEESLHSGPPFNYAAVKDGQTYITSYLPIQNSISQEPVGYLIISRINEDLYDNRFLFISSALVVITIIGILIFIIHIFHTYQKTLKQKNKLLEEVQHNAKLGFWELDIEHNALTLSNEIYNIFGVKPQNSKRTIEDLTEYVHPEDRILVRKTYENSIINKSGYQVRYRVLREDGSVIHVNEIAYHEFNDARQPIKSIGTVQDITELVESEIGIQELHNQLESVISKVPDIVYRCTNTRSQKILYINDAVEYITGYSKSDFLKPDGRTINSIIHPDDVKMTEEVIKNAIQKDQIFKVDYRIIDAEGTTVFVQEIGQKSISPGGQEVLDGTITDLSLEKDAFGRMGKFLDIQDNIVVLTDGEKLKFANKKFFELLGFDNLDTFLENHNCLSDLFIENDQQFHPGKIKDKKKNWIDSLLTYDEGHRIVSIRDKHQEIHVFAVSINAYELGSYVITFSDISENYSEKQQYMKKAHLDPLTGAYNREFFSANINRLIGDSEVKGCGIGFIIFDIDNFKSVNDNHGHTVGDKIIRQVVEIVNHNIRETDKLIRWGGDEFVLIAESSSIQGVQKQAEKLCNIIAHFEFDTINNLTCSFGCSLYNSTQTIDETYKSADEALYKAKRSGKNKVVTTGEIW